MFHKVFVTITSTNTFKKFTLDLIAHLSMTDPNYDIKVTFVDSLYIYTYFVLCFLHISAPELAYNFCSNCGSKTWNASQVDF